MRLKLIISLLNLILFWKNHVGASNSIDNLTDEQRYEQGIEYRNAKNYKAAIDSFIPLAKQKYVKAQHNLAMAFWHIGDEQQAYQWLKRAADVDFKPSINNIKNMNLMYLLLPDEMISEIVSHLTMSELCTFNQLSKRAYCVSEDLMLSTDYLTSTLPFAQYIKLLLADIKFKPQPESIYLIRSINALQGDIEVHYRDHRHLENIAKRIKSCADDVYYVHDQQAVDGHEFIATMGSLVKSYLISVEAEELLNISDETANLHLPLMLPAGSTSIYMKLYGLDSSISTVNNSFAAKTLQTAEFIKNIDENLLTNRVDEARNILFERFNSRKAHPELYPELKDLCPSLVLLSAPDTYSASNFDPDFNSTRNIHVEPTDHVYSPEPFFYMAKSRQQMNRLKESFPDFKQAISLINPECSNFGIYCQKPLQLIKGFKIFTSEHLISIGTMNIKDYNLIVDTYESWWRFDNLIFARSIMVFAKSVESKEFEVTLTDESLPEYIRTKVIMYLCDR